MRIEGWQVDGFGIWHDAGVTQLGPGVTVFLGENEAGKTTLLAFLRAMLFGFPDRRGRENLYPPLAGGRHGGRVVLRDEDGAWTLARYADKRREIGVVGPDGRGGDENDLRRLLSGVDAALFTSVFAFSLAELQQFATLDAQGIRERIFSVGISGAGHSARSVLRQLGDEEARLLKQRSGQAVINDLVRAIARAEDDVRAAEEEAATHSLLLQHEAEQAEHVTRCDASLKSLTADRRRYEAYIALRPESDKVAAADRALAELPNPADPGLPGVVADLAGRLAVLHSREESLPELRAELAGASAELEQQRQRLGPDWPPERIRATDDSIAARDAVREWRRRLQETAELAQDAEREEQAGRQAVAELEADRRRCLEALPGVEPPPTDALEERDVVLRSLRTRLRDLRAAELQERPSGGSTRGVWLPAAVAALLALAGAVVALLAGEGRIALGLLFGAALLAVVAGLGFAASGRVPPAGDGAEAARAELRAEIAAEARVLGLDPRPSEADLNALESQLARDRTQRTSCDGTRLQLRQLDEKLAGLKARLDVLAEDSRAARSIAEERQAAWARWLDDQGLPGLSPDGVLELLEAIRGARDAEASQVRAGDALHAVEAERLEWSRHAREALQDAGLSPSPPEARPDEELLALHDALTRRAAIVSHRADCDQRLREGLRSFDDPAAALRELVEGDPALWRDELLRLDGEHHRIDEERTAAIERRTDARRARESLEASADVPRLQAELESLRSDLARAVHEYRVVTTASALVRETLRTYIRERQPRVLEQASNAFADVTKGRFRAVVQQVTEDVESIVVEQADGTILTPDQLSRGTCEQLYLTIRLALAGDFAARGQVLPLIMDDCLVNFDPGRAAAMARLIAASAADSQCLFFTCHPSTADLLLAAAPAARLVTLAGREPGELTDKPPLFTC